MAQSSWLLLQHLVTFMLTSPAFWFLLHIHFQLFIEFFDNYDNATNFLFVFSIICFHEDYQIQNTFEDDVQMFVFNHGIFWEI